MTRRSIHSLLPALAIMLAAAAASAEDIDYCELGLRAQQAGDDVTATADFDRCLDGSARPSLYRPLVLFNRGSAHIARGQYEDAIVDLDAAIKAMPGVTLVYNLRAAAYDGLGDYERAIDDYDTAIRLEPNDAAALTGRGMVYEHKRQYDRAIADFDAALKQRQADYVALTYRGLAYGHVGRFDSAFADLNFAIELRPSDGDAFISRGIVYGLKGDFARAIADYDAAVKLLAGHAGSTAVALFGRGIAYSRLGKRALADQDFRQAAILDPSVEAKASKIGLVR